MGLFSSKNKMSINDFCINYYDKLVFPSKIAEMDPWSALCEAIYKQIADIDSTFNQVDLSTFNDELRSVQLEMFSVALSHQVKTKLVLEQSRFTKDYLDQKNYGHLWESMGNYNSAIARAADGGYESGSHSESVHILSQNKKRATLFDSLYDELGYDPVVIARVVNRTGSLRVWKVERGTVYLAFELARQINSDNLNDEALNVICSVIYGYYLGALGEIKKVKLI